VEPPPISFQNTTDLKKSLISAHLLSKEEEPIFDKLAQADLPPLLSPTILAIILGISPKLITAMARHPRRDYPYYRKFTIAKKSGGVRTILAPRTFLKAVQKYILRKILERQPLPAYVTGFVRKRGIIQNGEIHVGARHILNVDIKDFFPSIGEAKVTQVFSEFGFPKLMAWVLSRLTTFNGGLPQGAPTSPCLANLVFKEVDEKVLKLARDHRLKYSRYADDLTFSGPNPIERRFLDQLINIITRYGFQLNAKKIRFAKPGQPKYVTGLVVNERVHPSREQRRRLRAMFHNASLNERKYQKESSALLGWASFVHSYDKAKGKEYIMIARRVASLSQRPPKKKMAG
jgi:retron-type reverse transcriptase